MSLPSVHAIETAALKAWPGLEVAHDGSWVLRAANGYTKRANSVQSFNPADDDAIAARLQRAAHWFGARGLPAIFRVTPLAGTKLREELAASDWEALEPSQTLAMTLEPSSGADPRLLLTPPTDPQWLDVQARLRGYDGATRERLRSLGSAIAAPAIGAVLVVDGSPVATAIAVVADHMAYTGNVITAAGERGRGYGTALMRGIHTWAVGHGARFAAINMVADNAPAQRLYAAVGYTHHYDYHYARLRGT